MSPHIPSSVNDSTTLVNQVSDNATNAEFATNDVTHNASNDTFQV